MKGKPAFQHDDRNMDHETKLHAALSARPNIKDPHAILSLLETDQVVAAKSGTRFGQRKLSWGVRAMFWGLRVYVVFMLVIVAISVMQALHSAGY